MNRHRRRTLKDIRNIREQILDLVRQKGRLTLSELMDDYADKIGVRKTASDRHLVKRQLKQLAGEGCVEFVKMGRHLVVRNRLLTEAESKGAGAKSEAHGPSPELEAIRAYAIQLEQFARSLQEQIGTLVRMVDKATK